MVPNIFARHLAIAYIVVEGYPREPRFLNRIEQKTVSVQIVRIVIPRIKFSCRPTIGVIDNRKIILPVQRIVGYGMRRIAKIESPPIFFLTRLRCVGSPRNGLNRRHLRQPEQCIFCFCTCRPMPLQAIGMNVRYREHYRHTVGGVLRHHNRRFFFNSFCNNA